MKLNRRLISIALVLGLTITGSVPFINGDTSVTDLQQQKQSKQAQLNEIMKKILDYQTEIKQKQSQANTLKNNIAILNLQIQSTEAQIQATESKIDATNLEIADVTGQIIETEKQIVKQKDILRELISQINDLDQMSPLEIALENDNFTDFLNQLQYATSIQERSQQVLGEIKQLNARLVTKNAELKKQKSDLDVLNESLNAAKKGLVDQQRAKQAVLDQTRGQERAYQKLLNQQQSLQGDLEKQIFDLEVELNKRLGNKRLPSIKGLIDWPMDGVLTQGFGNTGFTKLGYTYHNGIDIAAPAGTPIYAVADGVVEDTDTNNFASYGNWVTVRHTIQTKSGPHQLISLYAHMSSFRVRKGQQLKRGDLIGFEGNTGNTTRLLYGPGRGYHIHFGLYDADGYGVTAGKYPNLYGPYRIPYGATYNPLEYL